MLWSPFQFKLLFASIKVNEDCRRGKKQGYFRFLNGYMKHEDQLTVNSEIESHLFNFF